MVLATINVRRFSNAVQSDEDGISGSLALQHNPKYPIENISKQNKQKQQYNKKSNRKMKTYQKVDVNPDNVSNPNSSQQTASTEEIIDQAGDVLKASANVAQTIGAENTADILNKSGNLAKSIPVAVQGIKKEIEPVKSAGKKLWKSLQDKGIVSRKEKVNLKDMHKK